MLPRLSCARQCFKRELPFPVNVHPWPLLAVFTPDTSPKRSGNDALRAPGKDWGTALTVETKVQKKFLFVILSPRVGLFVCFTAF